MCRYIDSGSPRPFDSSPFGASGASTSEWRAARCAGLPLTINRFRLDELSLESRRQIQAALIAIGRRRDATYSRRWARIALEVLRRLPGGENEYETLINYKKTGVNVSKRVFREFFSVLGAAYSVTQER